MPPAHLGELPAELLLNVFQHLLLGPREEGGGWRGVPLRRLAPTWFALRLTCRWWGEVLRAAPLAADVDAASPQALAWLASLPVRQLRVGRFGAVRERRRAQSAPALHAQPLPVPQAPLARLALEERPAWAAAELPAPDLLAAMLFTAAGCLSPAFDITRFSHLQVGRLVGRTGGSSVAVGRPTADMACRAGQTLEATYCGRAVLAPPFARTGAPAHPLRPPFPVPWCLRQVLHLKGALSSTGEPCAFSSAPLTGLPRLLDLRLERFTHFDLSALPPSLRSLR